LLSLARKALGIQVYFALALGGLEGAGGAWRSLRRGHAGGRRMRPGEKGRL